MSTGTKKQLSPEETPGLESVYFELQAMFGATKHAGGLRATRELIELCHIDRGKYVLDVGCGVGMTPCYIARKYRCRMVGVDIREKMTDRANERARRAGIENRVEFRAADVQDLPFEDDLFDAVIGESIIAFVEDKQRAVNECARVTKPGGYVGLNEATWMKASPPTELVEYYFRTTGTKPETSDGWVEFLVGSGLKDVVVRTYKMSVLTEYIDGIRRFSLKELLRTGHRFLSLSITSPAFRRFAKEAVPSATIVKAIFEYLGYGLYVGKK